MDNETIPWDFLQLLMSVIGLVVLGLIAVVVWKARQRNRLTSPNKDYVYKSEKTPGGGRKHHHSKQ